MLLEPLMLQIVAVVLHRAVDTIVNTAVGLDASEQTVSEAVVHSALCLLERGVRQLNSADATARTSAWISYDLLVDLPYRMISGVDHSHTVHLTYRE